MEKGILGKIHSKLMLVSFLLVIFIVAADTDESKASLPYCGPHPSLRGDVSKCVYEKTNESSLCWEACFNAYCVVEQDIEDCRKACAGCCLKDDLDGDCNPDTELDNCPGIPNLMQLDTDSDLVGDACDNCPETPNGWNGGTCTKGHVGIPCNMNEDCDCDMGGFCSKDQEDTDGDGIGDACENITYQAIKPPGLFSKISIMIRRTVKNLLEMIIQ